MTVTRKSKRRKTKAKRKYVLKFRTKLFIMLLFLGYFASLLIQQEWEMRQQSQTIENLQEQITEVSDGNEILHRRLMQARSDEHIEKVARDVLGWVKDGEIIFIEKKDQ